LLCLLLFLPLRGHLHCLLHLLFVVVLTLLLVDDLVLALFPESHRKNFTLKLAFQWWLKRDLQWRRCTICGSDFLILYFQNSRYSEIFNVIFNSGYYNQAHLKKKKINKFGDLYSAYPALPGGSRRWEQSVLPG
jgi:hypothetical protein